jgi:A/G-specific adenine glycosylase
MTMAEPRLKYFAELSPLARDRFQASVLAWYRIHGRDLPWRKTRDPYAVIVSEIMLHQTQVSTVLPVYQQFMATFPTVRSLASADPSDVKQITDPLGYKIRGQWLLDIAKIVTEQWHGEFPRTVEALSTLPGVGRYTAGAVLSFAFEEKAPILDTNVNRFLGRYFGADYRNPRAEYRHQLWALAEAVVPDHDVHAFNQALMDLGATVCTSRKPACLTCPVYANCQSGGPISPSERAAEESVQYHRRLATDDQRTVPE